MSRRVRLLTSYLCFAVLMVFAAMWVCSYRGHIGAKIRLNSSMGVYLSLYTGQMTLTWRQSAVEWRHAESRLYYTSSDQIDSKRAKQAVPRSNFRLQLDPLRIELPLWFVVLTTGVITAIVRPIPRWRFSLRDLFVYMTIAVVIMGEFAMAPRLLGWQ